MKMVKTVTCNSDVGMLKKYGRRTLQNGVAKRTFVARNRAKQNRKRAQMFRRRLKENERQRARYAAIY